MVSLLYHSLFNLSPGTQGAAYLPGTGRVLGEQPPGRSFSFEDKDGAELLGVVVLVADSADLWGRKELQLPKGCAGQLRAPLASRVPLAETGGVLEVADGEEGNRGSVWEL